MGETQEASPPLETSGNIGSKSPGGGAPLSAVPWWIRVVPFFLSAFLFLSALFSVFSPLPLLVLQLRTGRKLGWAAVATNCAIVLLAGGAASLVVYLVFVVVLSVALPEFLRRRLSLERAGAMTLLCMAAFAALFVAGYSQIHHVNPFHEIHAQVKALIDFLAQNMSTSANWMSDGDLEEWKQNLLVEFPSAVAVFSLILVWLNLVLLIRSNPNQMRERLGIDPLVLRKWKAPDWMVWPTILSGFLVIFDHGPASGTALNVFKFLMAMYGIQGLSILAFFFDLWKIKGIFRLAGYLVAIVLMMPLLLSLGFFDLWFDFRSKFRQT